MASVVFAAVIVARADDLWPGLRILLLAWLILLSIPLVGRMCQEDKSDLRNVRLTKET